MKICTEMKISSCGEMTKCVKFSDRQSE